MQKTKANALWNELTAEQQETLERWLVEERLSYAEAWPRAQAELGFKGSIASLKRFYLRRRKERTIENLESLAEEVTGINGTPMEAAEIQSASMKLLARLFFEQLQEAPDKVKELGPVMGWLVQNDRNNVRREWLKLAKERFQSSTVEQALKALPELVELAEAKKDPQTKRYEENAHLNRVRRAMFGAGREVHPESAQEEAEMVAAKREREARKERETEAERNREKITDAQPPTPSSQYYREYIEKKKRREEEKWRMNAEYEI